MVCTPLGVALLALGIILSLMNRRGGGSGGERTWRGEKIDYGSQYGSFSERVRRMFGGRR
jgi:hypothetical protein